MRGLVWVVVAGLVAVATAASARDTRVAEFSGGGTWNTPEASAVQQELARWLDERKSDAAVRDRIKTLWEQPAEAVPADAQLDRLAASFAAADDRAAELVTLCASPRQTPKLPDVSWLADEATPRFERANLRLYLGRWMIHNQLFDEALSQLESLEPNDVVDPAGLLFYQAIAYQRMLKKEPGLRTLDRLLEKPDVLPKRYVSLARLLQSDLQQLKDDSLDHISRRMDDVERRLDLGRPGQKTREVEDGVIKSLDKLIKDLEEQAAAAAAAAGAQGNIRSSSPAPDSRPLVGKGPGQVANKDIGNKDGWGELPPKQRQEALQQIGRDFPAHYRDLIEQYFRELATEEQP
jgi:hypothetical protein